jgi:hypothetical protein
MSDPVSAIIIPFPGPRAAEDPQARLTRALANLEAALAVQRAAVAGWRAELRRLDSATAGLGRSLVAYQASLARLGVGVERLRGEALRMEAWADQVLASGG